MRRKDHQRMASGSDHDNGAIQKLGGPCTVDSCVSSSTFTTARSPGPMALGRWLPRRLVSLWGALRPSPTLSLLLKVLALTILPCPRWCWNFLQALSSSPAAFWMLDSPPSRLIALWAAPRRAPLASCSLSFELASGRLPGGP